MPRLSKREKEEWAFFIDEKTGRTIKASVQIIILKKSNQIRALGA